MQHCLLIYNITLSSIVSVLNQNYPFLCPAWFHCLLTDTVDTSQHGFIVYWQTLWTSVSMVSLFIDRHCGHQSAWFHCLLTDTVDTSQHGFIVYWQTPWTPVSMVSLFIDRHCGHQSAWRLWLYLVSPVFSVSASRTAWVSRTHCNLYHYIWHFMAVYLTFYYYCQT